MKGAIAARRIIDKLARLVRRMRIPSVRKVSAALAVAVFGLDGGAAQAQNSPAAQQVLDRAREASGGARGWNTLRGLHETGQDGGVRYERWTDPLRYGDRTETHTPAGKHVQAYNGAAEWRILPSGTITGSVEPMVVAKVRSEAFFGAYAYYYPSRFDLRSSHIGSREARGRTYDVVRMQPAGGRPRELWFDRGTGLLGQVVEEVDGKTLTTEISDYRKVGPVTTPFRYVTYGGDLKAPRERKVEKIDFRPADRALFSLPPPKTP